MHHAMWPCASWWNRGQINLKAFVQFVHFVPLATFHSVAWQTLLQHISASIVLFESIIFDYLMSATQTLAGNMML